MSPLRHRTILSHSVEQTLAVGRTIGSALRSGDVVALVGPLGAGKTYLVKGIAAGLAVEDLRKVTSPTFVLVNEYRGRLHLFHIDAYRLSVGYELEALGFDEILATRDSVVVIEWADRVADALPPAYLEVRLQTLGPTERSLTASSVRNAGDHLLTCLDSPDWHQ